MHPIVAIIGIVLVIVLAPAVWRLMDEDIDWSRYSIPHHTARLARRTITRYRARREQQTGHQHVWHRIATCKCGAFHRETSTP